MEALPYMLQSTQLTVDAISGFMSNQGIVREFRYLSGNQGKVREFRPQSGNFEFATPIFAKLLAFGQIHFDCVKYSFQKANFRKTSGLRPDSLRLCEI